MKISLRVSLLVLIATAGISRAALIESYYPDPAVRVDVNAYYLKETVPIGAPDVGKVWWHVSFRVVNTSSTTINVDIRDLASDPAVPFIIAAGDYATKSRDPFVGYLRNGTPTIRRLDSVIVVGGSDPPTIGADAEERQFLQVLAGTVQSLKALNVSVFTGRPSGAISISAKRVLQAFSDLDASVSSADASLGPDPNRTALATEIQKHMQACSSLMRAKSPSARIKILESLNEAFVKTVGMSENSF